MSSIGPKDVDLQHLARRCGLTPGPQQSDATHASSLPPVGAWPAPLLGWAATVTAVVAAKMAETLAFHQLAPQIAPDLPTLAKSPFARYLGGSITFSAS